MEEKTEKDHGWAQDEYGVSHLVYTFPQGVERIVQGVKAAVVRLADMRPMLIPQPFKIGHRNRTEWCLAEHRIGQRYNDDTGEEEGGFKVRVELRDFGSECPPSIEGGSTLPDRILHVLNVLAPLERLVMFSCYTPEGYYLGDLGCAMRIYGAWGLTDVMPTSVAAGGSASEAVTRKLSCAVGFDPKEEKWVGWSHRAASSFGVGYVAQEGYCETSDYPDSKRAVPVGFEVKTLDDAKRCAVAFAASVS